MSTKKVLVFSIVGALLLALPVSNLVLGKAHVPVHKVQVCHNGDPVEVITVSQNALDAHIAHGDCQLPACDFANVFQTGDPCDLASVNGECTPLPAPRTDACGITSACPAGPDCF